MVATKLSIYNGAARLLGDRRLASTSEDRPLRRYLDEVWDDGLVDACLEQGLWKFATRSIEATASASVTPDFGYQYAFDKPDDYIRTAAICTDQYFRSPLQQYSDEQAYWFADLDIIYIQYISNDTDYGNDYSLWPSSFQAFMQAMLADGAKENVTGNDGKYERIKRALKEAKSDARSKDAMNQPVRFAPAGSWVKARMSSSVNSNG